jgi:hypothetical protein
MLWKLTEHSTNKVTELRITVDGVTDWSHFFSSHNKVENL